MPERTKQFLTYLNDKWENSLPLRTLWEINLSQSGFGPSGGNENKLITNITNILNIYESQGGPDGKGGKYPIRSGLFDQRFDGVQGLTFLAQSITLPTDAFGVDYIMVPNMGFKGGYVGSTKETYQTIDVEFIETNEDIVDNFMRPWALAAGYKGLVEDGDENTHIKADLELTLYTRGSPRDYISTAGSSFGVLQSREWRPRKKYRFLGVVPVSTPGETLSYDPNYTLTRKVSFAFKDYYLAQV